MFNHLYRYALSDSVRRSSAMFIGSFSYAFIMFACTQPLDILIGLHSSRRRQKLLKEKKLHRVNKTFYSYNVNVYKLLFLCTFLNAKKHIETPHVLCTKRFIFDALNRCMRFLQYFSARILAE